MGVPAHYWGSLDVEIAEHFVAPPSTNEFDAVVMDTCTEEGHGSCGAEGASGYIRRDKAKGWAEEVDGLAKDGRDVGGGCTVPLTIGGISGQWCSQRGFMSAEVNDVFPNDFDLRLLRY